MGNLALKWQVIALSLLHALEFSRLFLLGTHLFNNKKDLTEILKEGTKRVRPKKWANDIFAQQSTPLRQNLKLTLNLN